MRDPVRRDSVITVIGLSLLVAAFVFAVYLPGQRVGQEVRREIAEAEQSIREIPLRVAELESLRKDLERRRSYLRATERLMLRNAELHDVIRQVSRLAEASKLTVSKLEPQPPAGHETYHVQPLRLSFAGDFRGVVAFLKGMESSDRLFTVKEFTLNGDETRSGGTVRGEIDFSVYVRRANFSDFDENDASLDARIADMKRR